ALLLAWRLLIFKRENESDEVPISLNQKDESLSIKDIDSISIGTNCATTSIAATAMESASSIEALKALLSTDSISDDRLAEHHQHLLTESQFISQCSSPQDSEYFLRYGNNTYNTERYLLAIPELEIELSFLLQNFVFVIAYFASTMSAWKAIVEVFGQLSLNMYGINF
uniref:Anoctamin n=1 Tax=Loa loa TaxID=7209 RepID=A0A1I7W214_LOALO